MSSTPTLDARLHRAALRLRLERALDGSVLGASAGLALLGLGWLGRAALPNYLPLACAALAAVIAGARAVARLPILNRLDRSHDLHDLLASAWSLARLPQSERSLTTQAVMARAERAAAALDVSRAQPLRAPRRLGFLACALLFAALVLAWRGPVQPPPSAAGERARPITKRAQLGERLLSAEALAVFRAQLARLDPEPRADGGAAVLRAELDALLERLAREPMDRLAALRKLRELESRANALAARRAAASPGDPEARADAAQIPSAGDDRALAPPPPSAAEPDPAPEPEPESQGQAQAPGGPGQPSPPGAPAAPGSLPPPVGGSTPPVGGLPQPIAAAPAGPGKTGDAPRGPELERRPVPEDPERARGLADAIAELRELLRREPPSDTQARDAPRTPQASQPADDRSERPGAAAASAAAQKPSSGDAAKPESEAPQLPAAATRIEAEQGGGPLRSQVIYGAAERGFAGREYARVHAEYEDHAERELERDQLPPGYRGYVRRYFQAIAPRPSP